uniref:FAD-binding protein n=1 Tax=Megasphaera stantonii TaxID=2144175 RepID=UPI000E6BC043
GIIARDEAGGYRAIEAAKTILASGGVGGLYERSTNFPHLTGDAIAIARRHGIALEHIDYVQIHPTSLYTTHPGRSFLISESVRGEGARLYGKDGRRFASEVLPRNVMTAEIRKQM